MRFAVPILLVAFAACAVPDERDFPAPPPAPRAAEDVAVASSGTTVRRLSHERIAYWKTLEIANMGSLAQVVQFVNLQPKKAHERLARVEVPAGAVFRFDRPPAGEHLVFKLEWSRREVLEHGRKRWANAALEEPKGILVRGELVTR